MPWKDSTSTGCCTHMKYVTTLLATVLSVGRVRVFTPPRSPGAVRADQMADPLATDDAFIPFSYGMPEMANSPGHALKRIPKHTPTPAAQPQAPTRPPS